YSSLGADFMRSACICTSASKAFNIAGLQNAQIVCVDAETRRKIDRAVNIHEICDVNPFGIVATEAAYTAAGAEWIDALCRYIWANYETACTYLHENLPQLEPCRLEGTYLMWVDVSTLGLGVEELCSRLRAEQHVWFAPGTGYGTGGEGYIRINLATQRQNVTRALERLTAFVKKLHA
ncbi:MAG: aminotransferase class I/II-fold pyridoxal phosphate-dependent enzyme, partial [Bacteroidaceae bacterium]|nr:aminotransferase class I/II-fold pyridoxal phosphate-dependent enzyme [Bacteroidaceae bacterium]